MKKASRKSPRKIDFSHQALADVPLNDKAPPPEDSIAWRLWLACQDLAEQALASQYVQGIKEGRLDPNSFGQYTLQDAVYCHHAESDYATLESRANQMGFSSLAAFATARKESYASYNKETFAAWHLKSAEAIAPGAAAQTYIDFEHEIATSWQPVYGVVAMIPCDQLWSFLASSLKDHATSGNLYSFWITDNDDWGGAYRLDNFIDAWFAEHPEIYDWDSALYVFRSCMTCELNFFRSACGQALVPMPEKK